MRDYARQQTAILLRRLAFQVNRAARSGDAESIHDLRVAIRRLSRCLRVFSRFYPKNSWNTIRKQLGGLMDAAGRVRDADIAIELLAETGATPRSRMITRTRDERQKAVKQLWSEIRRWEQRGYSQKWRRLLEL